MKTASPCRNRSWDGAFSGDDDQTTYSCTYRAFDTLPGEMKLEFYRPGAGTIAQVTVPLREAAEDMQQGGTSK